MIAATAHRVSDHTCSAVNAEIRRQTDHSVKQCAAAGPEAIRKRLRDLDEEWDIERCLETLAPSLTLTGLFLSAFVSRKWLVLPAVIQGFFLQHVLQGWCPPIEVLRRLGVRTSEEINEERYALKALRGDFRQASPFQEDGLSAPDALAAVRRS